MLKRLKIKNPKYPLTPGSYRITVEDLGSRFYIRNGLEYFSLSIREGMEGYCLSDFMVTKKLGSVIHLKKKGKRKK